MAACWSPLRPRPRHHRACPGHARPAQRAAPARTDRHEPAALPHLGAAGTRGTPQGAAGSVIQTLILTNVDTRTCELCGFPGVSYVAGSDGHQVGPAAAMSGPRGGEVVPAPGKAAGAEMQLVNVANYDAAVCKPTPVLGLRVYPPGAYASLYVERAGTGCAGTPPGEQISVKTVTAQ